MFLRFKDIWVGSAGSDSENRRSISGEAVKAAIEMLAKQNVENIRLIGGDPVQRADILELLDL